MATTSSNSLPSSEFFLGVAVTLSLFGVYKFVGLFHVPNTQKIEGIATKPLNVKPGSAEEVIVWGFNEPGETLAWEDGVPDLSHYVVRVEAFLRLINQPYIKKKSLDLSENPRGKCPFASVCGVVLDDSSRIIEQLKVAFPTGCSTRLADEQLSEEQHRIGYLMQEMLQGDLYWVMVSQRMTQPLGRSLMVKFLEGNGLPIVIRQLVAAMIWRTSFSALYGQGMGRLPRAEIIRKGRKAVECLSKLLGDQQFLFGNDAPSSYDADVYAWLAILFFDPSHKSYDWVVGCMEDFPNLLPYHQRMQKLLFPSSGSKSD